MTYTRIKHAVLATLIILSVGCSNDSPEQEEPTGKGSISALHAIYDLGSVGFLIEETTLAGIDFKDNSGIVEYDDLTYKFNFDILLPGDTEATRLATTEVDVVADKEYTFALTGSLASPEIILWQQFSRDWQAALDEAKKNDTEVIILDASFGHLATTAGELDIYLSSPGTAPKLGDQVATVQFGDLQESIELESGDYQLVATSVDDPADLLFASESFTLSSAVSVNFVVMDADDSETSSFVVRLLGSGSGTQLVDINGISTMRAVHAADNTGALDVIVGDGFAAPFVSNLEFGNRSVQSEIQTGDLNLNITPAGNPGSFLAEESIKVAKGVRYSFYLTGLPGQLVGVLLRDSMRRLSTHALLRVYQGSERLDLLDFYVVPEGSDIALLSPTLQKLAYTSATGYSLVVPGSYDFVFTLPGTKTIVAGPLTQDLGTLGIYDVVTADTAQTDIADIFFFQDE